jgi:hypothetical protein
LEDQVDFGTPAANGLMRWTVDLLERLPSSEAAGVVPGLERTAHTALPAGFRQTENLNLGLLQSLASMRPTGADHARVSPAVPKERIEQSFGQLPLSFEQNVGQADASVHFLAHGSGYGLYLTGTEAVMVLSQPTDASSWRAGGVNPLSFRPGERGV